MRQLVVLCLAGLTFVGCSNQFEPTRAIANQPINKEEVPGQPTKPVGNCWIYEALEIGSCTALINHNSLSGTAAKEYIYANSADARYKAPVRLIDLTKIDLSQKVTANFKLGDFLSTTKGRYGFMAEYALNYIQNVRAELGVPLAVTSGYRSPAYNKKIDGAKISRHMYGDAIDVAASNATPNQIRAACKKIGASYIQVYADGHVHCDWRNHPLDQTFVGGDPLPPTTMDIAAMSDEEYTELQHEIGGQPIITVASGEIKIGATITLVAELEEQEDPGVIMKEWVVRDPNGKVIESTDSELQLELSVRGRYDVQVRVGGYLEASYIVQVN